MAEEPILEFEKPVFELESKIDELKSFAESEKIDVTDQIKDLENKCESLKKEIYGNLTPWRRVQLARHPRRPYTLDYINQIVTDFVELHGDRNFADDPAIVAGMGFIDDTAVMIIGHQKGRTMEENIKRNFGSPNPEGYRKALRTMMLAAKFNRPVLTFLDTQGAYAGVGAEERGQAEAIARNLKIMSTLPVPIIITVIGEGGSGGALGIGVGDRILMLENAVYSVISPEGCASILYHDATKASELANALKLTAEDLKKLKVIDEIISEPLGGAHRDVEVTVKNMKSAILRNLKELKKIKPQKLIELRYKKFREMGSVLEVKEKKLKKVKQPKKNEKNVEGGKE